MKLSSAAIGAAILALGCISNTPRPMVYGADECAQCRMVITDPRYGAELVLTTGKVLEFDAIECMLDYSRAMPGKTATPWVIDFDHAGQFENATTAFYVQIPRGRSPMGRGLIAARDSSAAEALRAQ